MLRDFPACTELCQNLNNDFCFGDENKFRGGEGTGNEAMHYYFPRSYNGEK